MCALGNKLCSNSMSYIASVEIQRQSPPAFTSQRNWAVWLQPNESFKPIGFLIVS